MIVMMSVLLEQEISARTGRRARSRRRRGATRSVLDDQRPRRARLRLPAGVRTFLLALVVVGLTVTLVLVLPDLESVSAGEPILEATAPGLPSLRQGLVELERTEAVEHIVEPGETLSEIAARYDVEVDELAARNGLSNPHAIREGDTVVIPPVELR